jgi:integrase
LGKKIGLVSGVVRAKRAHHAPVVLTRDEVKRIIDCMNGVPRLMALMLYGAGLRLIECCRLRVKDIDFAQNETMVRSGKGEQRPPYARANYSPRAAFAVPPIRQIPT